MFAAFDAPDGVLSCSRRNESTTAPQSLTLLNSRFMLEQARALASKVTTIDEAWWRILDRDPTPQESVAATEFIDKQTTRLGSNPSALAELARGLMNTNEFLYVD